MKQGRRKLYSDVIDPEYNIDEIYEPLTTPTREPVIKESNKSHSDKYFVNLFSGSQVDLNVLKPVHQNHLESDEPVKDTFVSRIINNTKNPKRQSGPSNSEETNNKTSKEEYFCFNNTIRVTYPQTPRFKSLLQSPFSKFNTYHKSVIDELIKESDSRCQFDAVDLHANPNDFYDKHSDNFQTGKFLVGLGLTLKQGGNMSEALFFMKLACYCQPFSDKVWKRYISLEQEQGKLEKAFTLSKTAFLFTHHEDFAKSYLINGEKCGVQMQWLRGLLSSISNPQQYDKGALPESAKLQMKYSTAWKGIKILFQICRWNQFRLAVCSHIIFLAKFLENIGFRRKAMLLLHRSFSKSMSKLEIYTNYFEMKIRENRGVIEEHDIKEMKSYIDNISNENKYKLVLEIAQILYQKGDERYKDFIEESYFLAKRYCAPGTGCNKALKQIYFSVIKWKGICPPQDFTNDHIIFEKNRYRFINDQPLIENYEFSDWKYYLHYGIKKNEQLIYAASKRWPHTGRLIAEWIHVLRTKKSALAMLKIWREKIDEVPKSGELWCEGGRIYAQLHEYANALKCFKSAIHFTPQYGDSFIEELRIYLQQSQFLEIDKCRKVFLVSEPFYGHVLSYLKLNNKGSKKLSMSQVWQNAVLEIKRDIYRNARRKNISQQRLTAYQPYNQAFLKQETQKEKEWLFASYQQMENKN